MVNWGRLITAMVTPFDEDLNVNYEEAVRLAKKLVEEGNTGLVITGTTGEAPTLKLEEKVKLYEVIKANVNVPIIAGIGTNSTEDTIINGQRAIEAGVDGLLVVTPYYNKPDQKSLYDHFKKVAENLDAPIMLYNVPGRTGCNLLPETVEKLAAIENIVALKEAGGNINQISEIIRRKPKDFLVYSGDDSMTLPAMAVGAYGVVSVCSHIVSKEMREMIDAFVYGDTKKAMEIHLRLFKLFETLFIVSNPIPVKAALNLVDIKVGGLRLPLTEADEKVKGIIRRELENLGKEIVQ
ncbi:4-hydroxy-tetrahydrodipicolinate synthase [Tepidimicrobium xylanilyticum]|uniref:4-hydroxy-tetrahydrodipicolinate synthase n=1 Tax=Tepidimicrobium xylanilyticum TaxID=1123352 RepID=A0A1H3APW8_9FIRM|nr:4-hydroxy-tetrahydrodipicolinate synthase [Tepidimicrobium xylanilyticum]GMG97625.1 4-hydroxy-tetrahydrodipicolinate synthase [Tepidimicrobium xylanilyticum]SDX31752.1 4-hydroxy-tetrahydrodipicolinate synthase [Tepidimicrobium xylanilyticum]